MSYLPFIMIFNINLLLVRRRQSTSTNLLDTNPRGIIHSKKNLSVTWFPLKHFSGTLTQTSKSTSSVSDYLSGGKKTFTMMNNTNTPVLTRNEAQSSKFGNE
jgi:hypothetical protein